MADLDTIEHNRALASCLLSRRTKYYLRDRAPVPETFRPLLNNKVNAVYQDFARRKLKSESTNNRQSLLF